MLDFSVLQSRRRPAVFAHRGDSRRFHENTIPAFQSAIDVGCDGIELDVRRTADGVLVVHHNATISRTKRRINTLLLEDAGEFAEQAGYELPTLEAVLALCTGRIALDVELKEPGYEAEVVRLVKRFYRLNNVLFTSFRDESVRAVKETESSARTGLVLGLATPATISARLQSGSLVRRVRRAKAEVVVPHRAYVTASFCKRMARAELPIISWTVNTERIARRVINHGVSAIISDAPKAMLEIAGRRGRNE